MKLGSLDFCDGQKAHINSVHISRSYASLMEGVPTERLNSIILAQHAKEAKRIFWGRATHVVEPTITSDPRGSVALPPCCIMADMLSYEPAKNPKRMMSYAVLVWYQGEPIPLVSETIISWAARTRWSDIAQDGDW